MFFLDHIIACKRTEVEKQKEIIPFSKLKKSIYYTNPCISLKNRFINEPSPGIIAEFKRKSPSKGVINNKVSIEEVSCGYANKGAIALSVLTDPDFFGGNANDLITARKLNDIPLLRKDFIIDEYQIHEAKAWGADLILLIAACLTKKEITHFSNVAHNLGMEVIFEIHNRQELDKYNPQIEMVGVNNRNLKTFEVDINTSLDLIRDIPAECIKIAESGISEPTSVIKLWEAGYQGFLIGENFMKTTNPSQSLFLFINQLKTQ